MVTATTERIALRVSDDQDSRGLLDENKGKLGATLTGITDGGKKLIVDVPKEMQKKSLADAIATYSAIELFQSENTAFYISQFFQSDVQLSLLEALCIPGEEWLGLISFAGETYQPVYWRAIKTFDNPVFLRGDEVEHSERIYAEPKSVAGWEIRVQQPGELQHNDWILRRRLATLIESTIASLESGKEPEFPLHREVNNLLVRRPHQVNLPHIFGLGETIY